ncbi:uncharacterized protein LOC125456831 isoform X1 [Stegostoma tigrinum]|uniref:uncharacterized protein LOC125456831 isoform X1 n=1 Tax=Stegostoma tigrinum TaxID=3053191 RepID=UPI0028707F20|nr:uncharacterized protein LOC125456831 isoform X1 [Stegostoma tigrinum]
MEIKAVCVLKDQHDIYPYVHDLPDPVSGVSGVVVFESRANGQVLIKGTFTGLPRGKHGLHVCTFGNLFNAIRFPTVWKQAVRPNKSTPPLEASHPDPSPYNPDTSLNTTGNLAWPIHLTCTSLDCGRKPEHPEETHADMGRMRKLHTDSCLGRESTPGPWCCEAAVLTTESPCHP